jgi:hypothetical protein
MTFSSTTSSYFALSYAGVVFMDIGRALEHDLPKLGVAGFEPLSAALERSLA